MADTSMTFNSALADRVLGYIEAHPEQHNQGVWALQTECGTAACMCGWAALLSGWEFTSRNCGCGCGMRSLPAFTKDGVTLEPEELGSRLFGISRWQAGELFHATNTLDDLKRLCKDFANESVPS